MQLAKERLLLASQQQDEEMDMESIEFILAENVSLGSFIDTLRETRGNTVR